MEVFKIFGTLGLRDNEYRTGLSRAEQQGQRASNSINKGFKNTGSMFSGMGVAAGGFGASMMGMAGITVGVGAALAGTVSAGANFEKTLSSVKAMTGATDEQMAAMTKQAKALGADTKFSASQAAEGMAFLGMAGFKTNDIMKAMPGMLNLAAAGSLDLGRAADIASNIMAGFSIDAGQAGHASDVLAFAASNSNTSVEQLGEAMKYASGTASTIGLGLEETTAAMMSMADVGLQGSVAGQAFATSLGRLAKPTGEAKKVIDGLNLSFFDQQGKIKPLPDIIGELEKGMNGMTEQQKTATLQTIFGAEAFKNWAALLKTGSDKLRENTQALKDSDGAAKKMADTMNDNLIGKWDSFKSKLEGLAITIFERLAPALLGILAGAEAAVVGIDKFIQALIPMDSMIAGVTNLTTALGLMWKTASGDGDAGIQAVDLMTKMGLSPEMQEMAMSVIYNISNGIDMLKALVAGDWGTARGIGEKLGISPETVDQIIELTASIFGAVNNLIEGIENGLAAFAPVVMGIAEEVWNFIKGVFEEMLPYITAAVQDISSFLKENLDKIAEFWKENGTQIKEAVKTAFEFIKGVIEVVMPIIAEIISSTWEAIKSIISGALDIIMGIIKVFSSALTGDWKGVWEGIKQIFSGAWDIITGLFTLYIGKVTGMVGKFIPGLGKLFKPVEKLISKPFEMAWKAVKAVVDKITGAWDGIKGILGSVKEGASAVGNFVGGLVSGPSRAAAAPVNGFASGGIFKPNQERMIKIGDAKSYDEAVLPLNNSTLGKIGDRIAETMNGGGGSETIIIKPQPIILNGRQIAKAAGQEINRELGFQRGREVRV
ncbi:phage tail tape measure protein [Bacillus cereus group sp. BY9-3LC]|uniref:phage tail tape measure protein n=1 Tax=Bacillus cereus group sp. BY9-3LC TaxID=3018075 RepID=UPI0022E79FBA|nr:phage tail tape measure protein [Bacillus cereus group sp. BY9-3LC]MDA1777451.1 phage tail tape measure protein [Bacillus cereus group sp. BY9-3LC]